MEPIFEPVVNQLETALTNIGLYMMNVDIGVVASSKDQPVDDNFTVDKLTSNPEDYSIYITAMFQISDIAWTDRIINPDAHNETQEFKKIAPTEFEISLESFKDDLTNWDDED
jgi:hypothetical protein